MPGPRRSDSLRPLAPFCHAVQYVVANRIHAVFGDIRVYLQILGGIEQSIPPVTGVFAPATPLFRHQRPPFWEAAGQLHHAAQPLGIRIGSAGAIAFVGHHGCQSGDFVKARGEFLLTLGAG